MEGQQLPKATMQSFIKSRTGVPFSGEFVVAMQGISRDYVVRLSNKANEICEKKNRANINQDHIVAALVDLGLTKHIPKLRELGDHIKEKNQLKRETTQRLEEAIQKQKEEERQRKRLAQTIKKAVIVRQKFKEIEALDSPNNSEDFDYQSLARESNENQPNQGQQ